MSAQDWILIIGAIGTLVTIIGTQVILIIKATQTQTSINAAAQRREEIASAVLDPATAIQTAAPAQSKVQP